MSTGILNREEGIEMKKNCPHCNRELECYKNPFPTVDIIIEIRGRGIVLIKRKSNPIGWAIPGGFVDYGESLEKAAVREALEETSLNVELIRQMHTYSDPERDPRHHTISTVFIARAEGNPIAADDAQEAQIFTEENLPEPLVFDHRLILRDYFNRLNP
jgi:ADP-ribose pyrophosphatase YjhB (NUDIX family)